MRGLLRMLGASALLLVMLGPGAPADVAAAASLASSGASSSDVPPGSSLVSSLGSSLSSPASSLGSSLSSPASSLSSPASSLGSSLANGAEASRWSWPLGPPRVVVRDFEAPPTPYASGHRGIDLRAPAGTEVLAPEDGVVHFAGTVADRPVLSIRHADGLLSSFEPVETGLGKGDAVRVGDVVGTVADGGHCAGGCLHVGARLDGTAYVSPLLFLGGVPRAVLLPTRPIG